MIFLITPQTVLLEVLHAAKCRIALDNALPMDWVHIKVKKAQFAPTFELDLHIEVGPRDAFLLTETAQAAAEWHADAAKESIERMRWWTKREAWERIRGVAA